MTLVEHELAVLIGSDDLLLPGYVGPVRRAHRAHPDAAIIQPGVEVVDERGEPVRTLVDLSKRWVYAPRVSGPTVLAGEPLAVSLLRGNWLYFPALCWRTGPLRRFGFRDGLSVVQDLALVLDLVLDGESLLVEPTTAFRYRRHRASVSSAQAADGRRFAEERAFFAETADRMAAQGWPRAARAARNHVSSRINALTQLPVAIRHRRRDGVAHVGPARVRRSDQPGMSARDAQDGCSPAAPATSAPTSPTRCDAAAGRWWCSTTCPPGWPRGCRPAWSWCGPRSGTATPSSTRCAGTGSTA